MLNSKPARLRRRISADKNSELLNKHSSNSDSENKLSSSGPLQHWKEFWMIVQFIVEAEADGLVAVVTILRPLLVNLNRNYEH